MHVLLIISTSARECVGASSKRCSMVLLGYVKTSESNTCENKRKHKQHMQKCKQAKVTLAKDRARKYDTCKSKGKKK